jgi:hypothetical protein
MKLGAEPKKIAILGGLLAVAAIALYINVFSSDEQPAARPPAPPVDAAAQPARPAVAGARPNAGRRPSGKAALGEFRPKMGTAEGETKPDPASVDPALHLDLLAKLQAVEMAQAGRNLFQYGTAPAPPAPKPSPLPAVAQIPINKPPPVNTPPPGPPLPPPPPPVNVKYYGFKTLRSNGVKQAFLLDGEDIIIAGENEVVKKRYRVVRIGPASIVFEDLEGKGQQTVAIEAQPS